MLSWPARPWTSDGPPLRAALTVPPETAAQKVAMSLPGLAVSMQSWWKRAMPGP